jgi:hypothetical protein
VKAVVEINSQEFQYLRKKFPNISTANLQESIIVGPRTREIVEDEVFLETLTDTERAAWESFKWVCTNFLGRKKSPDFSDGIQKLLNAYKEMGCRMPLKVHFLHSNLDFFPETLVDSAKSKVNAFMKILNQ